MSEMIEFRPDLIIQIFLIFALGYVILIIPIGMLTTYLSNKRVRWEQTARPVLDETTGRWEVKEALSSCRTTVHILVAALTLCPAGIRRRDKSRLTQSN